MKILLTGGDGYIAKGIKNTLGDKYAFTSINRSSFDLTNLNDTKYWFDYINDTYFDIVIHTAITGGNRLLKETSSVLDNNIKMYLNLLECQKYYGKFINIGSGAEFIKDSFYGLSKKVIDMSISDKELFYSLRVYGLFDERENDRRFIKNNIYRYINQEPIIIHQNKRMDFFYFKDFITILDYYINNNNLPKNINCVYKTKYFLTDIAKLINDLDSHTVNVSLANQQHDKDYIGDYHSLSLNFIGLEEGINEIYRNLKNEKNMVRAE